VLLVFSNIAGSDIFTRWNGAMVRVEAWTDKAFLRVGSAIEMIGFSESFSFPEPSIGGG
jgi:hypothetical protein